MGRAFQNRKESMAKTAGAKTKLYSRYGKEIYVCARNGGTDPSGNLSLRQLIDRAKSNQVPSHVIERAIEKAKGIGGENYETIRYEGFGPGGCMVIVDCLSDNSNRTFAEVRQCFVKTKAKIGSQGAVSHMFDHRAVFVFKQDNEDAVLEALMNADVDVSDIAKEDGNITVLAPHTEFFKAKKALGEAFPDIRYEVEDITFIPQTSTTISGEDLVMFKKFMEMLEECDDVQEVYHNAEYTE